MKGDESAPVAGLEHQPGLSGNSRNCAQNLRARPFGKTVSEREIGTERIFGVAEKLEPGRFGRQRERAPKMFSYRPSVVPFSERSPKLEVSGLQIRVETESPDELLTMLSHDERFLCGHFVEVLKGVKDFRLVHTTKADMMFRDSVEPS